MVVDSHSTIVNIQEVVRLVMGTFVLIPRIDNKNPSKYITWNRKHTWDYWLCSRAIRSIQDFSFVYFHVSSRCAQLSPARTIIDCIPTTSSHSLVQVQTRVLKDLQTASEYWGQSIFGQDG